MHMYNTGVYISWKWLIFFHDLVGFEFYSHDAELIYRYEPDIMIMENIQ